jgi:hypothetical protein
MLDYAKGEYYFTGTECSGNAYMLSVRPTGGVWYWPGAQGGVYKAPVVTGLDLMYVPRNSTPGTQEVASRWSSGYCSGWLAYEANVVPLLPNDTAVTGASTSQFAMPIVFGMP